MTKPAPSTNPRPARTSWLARSVGKLFGKVTGTKPPAKPAAHATHPGRIQAPTKAVTADLPPFDGLSPDRIHVPRTAAECAEAASAILAAGIAGFDTEAKPTFQAGEKSTGPHVVQFALTDRAYIFQLRHPECERAAAGLLASETLLKVGFGLKNDHGQIRQRFGVDLHHVLDLDNVFRRRGYHGQIGVRGAIGALLRQHFTKSKKTTTSNWAAATLTSRQLTYAANDAYAALKVMEALRLTPAEIATHQTPSRPKQPRPRRRVRRAAS